MKRHLLSFFLFSVFSILLFTATVACGKSEAEIAIDATKEAKSMIVANITATAVADEEKARDMINDYCDFLLKRFNTDYALPSIDAATFRASVEWLVFNAHSDSEIRTIMDAFLTDLERIEDGHFWSWHEAYTQSGSYYVHDCHTASWKP